MQIESVRIEGQDLILTTKGRDAFNWVYGFKPGDYAITRQTKKRSLDANAYAWALMDKLAEATGYKRTDIYRDQIREVGGISDYVVVRDDAVEDFCSSWCRGHIGRQAEVIRDAKGIPGCKVVLVYHGSSEFDTKQMSQLIDHIVQDCQQLGIETMPDEAVSSLLSQWDGRT